MLTKICKTCEIEKPIDDYYFIVKNTTWNSSCKKCMTAKSLVYYYKNKERINKDIMDEYYSDKEVIKRLSPEVKKNLIKLYKEKNNL